MRPHLAPETIPARRPNLRPPLECSLDPEAFATSKSQRQLLHRFNTFVMEGGREGAVGWGRLESDPVPHLDSGTFPAPSALLATSSTAKPERTVRPDSLLSRAISVTFNPSAQPTLDDDEDNGDFLAPSSSKRSKRLPRNPALPPVKEGSQATASENVAEKGNRKEKAKEKAKAKATHPTDLVDLIHEPEWSKSPPDRPFKHRFEVRRELWLSRAAADLAPSQYVLEEASFTDEKYELFRTYQVRLCASCLLPLSPEVSRRPKSITSPMRRSRPRAFADSSSTLLSTCVRPIPLLSLSNPSAPPARAQSTSLAPVRLLPQIGRAHV